MIIGKLLHSICPLCTYQELLIAESDGKRIAYCPNGGDEKTNTHTGFFVGETLEHRIKYVEKPKKRIVRKTETDREVADE
jgi:hypothetical protein